MVPRCLLASGALVTAVALLGCGTSTPRQTAPTASSVVEVAPGPAASSSGAGTAVDAPSDATPLPFASKRLGHFEVTLAGKEKVDAVLVESIAALDQPAGVRGVALTEPQSTLHAEILALAFEKVALAGAAAVDAFGAETNLAPMLDAMKRARGRAAVKAALDDGGVQVYGIAQGTFLLRDRRIDKASASNEDLDAIGALLRIAEKATQCVGLVCAATDAGGVDHGAIVFGGSATERRIVGVFGLALPAPAKPSGTPRVVKFVDDWAATERALVAAGVKGASVLGQAPLFDSEPGARAGTIGLALWTEPETQSRKLAEVVVDGAFTAVLPIELFEYTDFDSAEKKPHSYEARFADVDGDGRVELIARRTSYPYDGEGAALTSVLVRAPASLRGFEPLVATVDHDFDPWLIRAKTVDDAAAAVVAAKPYAMAPKDACALVKQLGTTPGMTRVATTDAIVLGFMQPGSPTFVTGEQISPLGTLEPMRRGGPLEPCEAAECVGAYCSNRTGPPGSGHAWFERDEKGNPRVTMIAVYNGS